MLNDRVVLISGATGALGSAVAREFAQTEACLALTGRSEKKLKRLVAEMDISAERVFTVVADVGQADDVRDLVDAVVAHLGRVDVLLNTVGGWSGGKLVGEIPVEEWDRMLALNLQTAFLLSQAVLPPMRQAGWGRIIHVSSKTAVVPRAKQAAYAVSKMGLITLTEIIAAEVKGTPITANVILPSTIDTSANRTGWPKADSSKWVPPERIAATMRFLCSDAAASMNGARVPIYGAA
jgi:NAD(P)-dependent dehydrogenase (short-subunit alcohol dehydrogenase family)